MLLRNFFQPDAEYSARCGSGVCDPLKQLGVMLETIVEPVLVRLETNEDAGRTTVARDDDLVRLRQPEIPRKVILHLRECHPPCSGSPEP